MSNIPPNSSDSIGTNNRVETETDSGLSDSSPLWKYVTKLEKSGKGGGNISFKCNFCENIYKRLYYRVKCHLLKIQGGEIASCCRVIIIILSKMQKVMEKAKLKVKQSIPRQVPLPTTIGSYTVSVSSHYELGLPSFETKKRKGMSGPFENAFNIGAREQLDGEIARMFYTGGLSFHFARNAHYVQAFKTACSNSIPGYFPPGYNTLRTTFLQKEKSNIERLLKPIKVTWKKKGVSVCNDGWSDYQKKTLY
ncbi:hypothetical protein Dsin_019576 [Dipteronia sinensis]|uniref:DUF659 domain-containing protein n=1 Tax=Dipteronia sinensis TaxID=43782 RepID=A0AAE0A7H8_9ROSI|nr:hypothetical protein Dsin_019576 [Dipteronia sinensis]